MIGHPAHLPIFRSATGVGLLAAIVLGCGVNINDNCLHPDANCFVEDTTVPVLSSSSPQTGVPTADISEITLTFSEKLPDITNTANYTLMIADGTPMSIDSADKNSDSEVVLHTSGSPDTDFTATLTVALEDYNGNLLDASYDFIVDVTPPVLSVEIAPGNGELTLNVSVTDTTDTTIRIYRNQTGFTGGPIGNPIEETVLTGSSSSTEDGGATGAAIGFGLNHGFFSPRGSGGSSGGRGGGAGGGAGGGDTGGEDPAGNPITAEPTGQTTVNQSGLTNGRSYYYYIIGVDSVGLEAAFEILGRPGVMEYYYPNNGGSWNAYITNDDPAATPDAFSASDVACNNPTGRYSKCIHGGEMRTLRLPGRTVCPAGLEIRDNLNALRWHCVAGSDADTDPIQFVSWRFQNEKGLQDIIDWTQTPPVWRDLHLVWSEPSCGDADCRGPSFHPDKDLVIPTTSGILNDPNVIYYMDAATANLGLLPTAVLSTGTTLVVAPGAIWNAGPSTALNASGTLYTWVEGQFTADAQGSQLTILGERSVARHLTVSRFQGGDVLIEPGDGMLLVNTKAWSVTLENICYSNTMPANYVSLFYSRADHCAESPLNADEFGVGSLLFETTHTQSALVLGDNSASFLGLFVGQPEFELDGDGTALLASTITHASAEPMLINGDGAEGSLLHNQLWLNNGDTATAGAVGGTGNPELFYGIISADSNLAVHGSPGGSTYLYDAFLYGNISGNICGGGDCSTGLATTLNTDYTIDSTGVTGVSVFRGDATGDIFNTATGINSAVAANTAIEDFVTFENRFRSWIDSDGTYPSSLERGPCPSDPTDCQVFDFSLSTGDAGNGGSPLALGVNPIPTNTDTFISRHVATTLAECTQIDGTWEPATFDITPPYSFTGGGAAGCGNLALKYAVEFPDDGFGDEDGFCESGEVCLYTPNAGAYQGHFDAPEQNCSDPYFHVGSVWCRVATLGTGVTISNVTLLAYDQNGY